MSEHRFDPEVVELLAGIARDPQASLLHVPQGRLLEGSGQEERISPHGSHLTKAEKYLVAAYREESANLLLEACILRLKEDPLVDSTIGRERTVVRLCATRVSHQMGNEEIRAIARGDEIAPSTLAATALRLAPSDLGLNCLALAHQLEGQTTASFRVLDKLLDASSSTIQRAQALANRAKGHSLRKEYRQALECNMLACHLDDRRVRYRVWCLTNAIQAGWVDLVRETARQLDAHPGRDEVTAIATELRSARSQGLWCPTPKSQAALRGLHEQESEGVGAIYDAFS